MSNQDKNQNSGQEKSSEVTRRDFIKYTAGTAACISLGSFNFGCGSNSSTTGVAGYPIDATVSTTVKTTIEFKQTFLTEMDPKNLQNVAAYANYGYGVWNDGPGLVSEKRDDIMVAGYAYPPSTSPSKQLLRFFAITDIHITDKESPSQAIYMEVLIGKETSSYSPAMLYSTQVLDAAIQTVNALHKQNRIDFGISLGDACNSTQYNELRWYIDVIDGKVIIPSSGAHVGAGSIDYQKPFKAAGLSPEIPWYQTIGNHDHFWLGSIPLDTGDLGDLRGSYISSTVIAMGNTLANASKIYDTTPPLYYMGVIDGSTATGAIIKAGKAGDPGFTSPPSVVPDPDRRSLNKAE